MIYCHRVCIRVNPPSHKVAASGRINNVVPAPPRERRGGSLDGPAIPEVLSAQDGRAVRSSERMMNKWQTCWQ